MCTQVVIVCDWLFRIYWQLSKSSHHSCRSMLTVTHQSVFCQEPARTARDPGRGTRSGCRGNSCSCTSRIAVSFLLFAALPLIALSSWLSSLGRSIVVVLVHGLLFHGGLTGWHRLTRSWSAASPSVHTLLRQSLFWPTVQLKKLSLLLNLCADANCYIGFILKCQPVIKQLLVINPFTSVI